MATRTRRTNTVEKILDTAADLFYANGLRGVGVDQVIAASGVAKSTLYVHFRTKDELVAAYLRRTDISWRTQLEAAAERAGDDAADRITGLFDALTDAFDRHGFFGCPFVSAAVETALDSDARAITVQHVEQPAHLADTAQHRGGCRRPRLPRPPPRPPDRRRPRVRTAAPGPRGGGSGQIRGPAPPRRPHPPRHGRRPPVTGHRAHP